MPKKSTKTKRLLLKSTPQKMIKDYLKKNGYSWQNSLIKEDLGSEIAVSVVIPVYNERGVVEETLRALNKQICNNFEVIIVDNGSTDETARGIKEFKAKANYPLSLISEPNPGVACARKTGMDEILGRLLKRGVNFYHFIAVTDADTIPPRDWIKKIIEGFKSEGIGGLAGTHGASKIVEKRIEEATGIRNYFNIVALLIEFLEENGIGEIKMSGPNSAFDSLAYALGDGIKQEYDLDGKLRLSEVNNLGKRIKKIGYAIHPMRCMVIKNRRRELFEITNGGEDSYFPKNYSSKERFNTISENEMEMLNFACERASRENWLAYRYGMVFKVIKNFVFQPLALGEITIKDIQGLFSPEEINFFLNNSSFPKPKKEFFNIFEVFLARFEGKDG